jgi:outer membrane receptor for ferric coprogen and ferric-rhodotorulic acid
VDWTALRQQEFRPTRDVFRSIPGVRLRTDSRGRTYISSARGNCPMQVYLDGIPIYRPDGPTAGPPPPIDQWSVSDFDAIEVYRGASETPIEFSGRGAACGTVMLWSRRH